MEKITFKQSYKKVFTNAPQIILIPFFIFISIFIFPNITSSMFSAPEMTMQTELFSTLGIINLTAKLFQNLDYAHFGFVAQNQLSIFIVPILSLLLLSHILLKRKKTKGPKQNGIFTLLFTCLLCCINLFLYFSLVHSNSFVHSKLFISIFLFLSQLLLPVIFAALIQSYILTVIKEKILLQKKSPLLHKTVRNFKKLFTFHLCMLPLFLLPEILYLLQQIISPINGNNSNSISHLLENLLPISFYAYALAKLLFFPLPLLLVGLDLSLWHAIKKTAQLFFRKTKIFFTFTIYSVCILSLPLILITYLTNILPNGTIATAIIILFAHTIFYAAALHITINILFNIIHSTRFKSKRGKNV